MGTITPVAYGTAGWLDPNNSIPVRTSSVASTTSIITHSDPSLRSYYFTALANADTWQSEIPFGHIDGVTVHHDQVGTETAGVSLSSVSGAAKATFICSNDAEPGWLVFRLNSY